MDADTLDRKLEMMSGYYKLKTKTDFVGNIVFVFVMGIVLFAIEQKGGNAAALLDIGLYLVLLIYMVVTTNSIVWYYTTTTTNSASQLSVVLSNY